MYCLIALLYSYSSASEAAVVGLLIGLITALAIAIISWISRKKAQKKNRKNNEDEKISSFAKSDYNTYYRLQIPELISLCNPQLFMNPYDHEKVSVSNELYVKLCSNRNLSTDEIIEIRKKAETVLGVRLSSTALFNYLKESCNPHRFMNPYNGENRCNCTTRRFFASEEKRFCS